MVPSASEESNMDTPSPRQCPHLRKCAMIEDLVATTYTILRVISPRDMSAFWTLLSSKLVQDHSWGGSPKTKGNHRHGQISKQLDMILVNTLENIVGYDCRDLLTTALGLAKIIKQVCRRESKTKVSTDSLNRIPHYLFIGNNS